MESKELCSLGLQLQEPWYVKEVHLEKKDAEFVLHIDIDHRAGSKFEYEGETYTVYDHQERRWMHLNFFEHKCELHARVPRVKTKEGKVKLVKVPWAMPGSSFTLKYEQDVLGLVREGLSASGIARRLLLGSKQVFGIVRRYVSYALATQVIESVKELSVDETSYKKGHNYFTILGDREAKKVVGVSIGKDKESFAHALVDMEVRGANRTEVKTITMDMSRSYISGASETMPQAAIVFDRFHISKKLNEAVDQIRKADRKQFEELNRSRYLWLTNGNKLTEKDRAKVSELSKLCPNIGEAYRLKELFKLILDEACRSKKITPLNEWIKEALNSGLAPLREFVSMLHNHWYGIKAYFQRLATNAYAERVNLKIQEIKRIAKGYRDPHNFIIMIYFHLGGLNLNTHYN